MLNERDIVLRFQALESAVRQLQPLALEALEARVTALEAMVTAPAPVEVAGTVDPQPVDDAPAPVSSDSADPEAAA